MPPSASDAPAAARGKFFSAFLNATACYLLAWLLVNFLYQAAQAFMARRAHVPGRWDLAGPHFNLPDSGWQHTMVLSVYGTGPLLVLALGIVALGGFWWQCRRRGLLKLLLLWVAFVAFNQVLGGLLADTITRSGWWFVPNWLVGAGTWPSLVLGLVLAAGQLALGYILAMPFLLAQDSRTLLQFDNRFYLIICALLGPWLAGSALLAASKLPHLGLGEVLHYATLGLLLVPLALGLARPYQDDNEVLPPPSYVAWGLVGLALLGVLAWRLALGGAGVRL
ncbi:MAG: hypothetical protein ACRYFK_02260 [Janthinobacterium lividum]